jgi:hypothetical protein
MLVYAYRNWTENCETFMIEWQNCIAIRRSNTRAAMLPLTSVVEQDHIESQPNSEEHVASIFGIEE